MKVSNEDIIKRMLKCFFSKLSAKIVKIISKMQSRDKMDVTIEFQMNSAIGFMLKHYNISNERFFRVFFKMIS